MQDLFGSDAVVRSLCLWQPYASLMLLNNKQETRWVKKGKKAPFPPGKYMIYSAKQPVKFNDVERVSGGLMPEGWKTDPRYFILGQPLFIADLNAIAEWNTALHRTDIESTEKLTFVKHEYDPGNNTHRRVILFFINIQRIKSFPYKGKQGVGILTPEEKAQIEFL